MKAETRAEIDRLAHRIATLERQLAELTMKTSNALGMIETVMLILSRGTERSKRKTK